MKKSFKILSLLALGSALCLGVTALSVASPSIFKPLEFAQRNAQVSGSVTFAKNDCVNVNNKGQVTSSLSNGGTIKAYSTQRATNQEFYFGTNQYVFFAYENNGQGNDSIEIDGNSYDFAPFQSLTNLKATNVSGTVKANYSTDGSTWSQKNVYTGLTCTLNGAKYLYLSGSSNSATISQIVLNYSCNSSVDPGEVTLTSISLSGSQKKEFFVGDTFEYTGLVVTANYSDDTHSVISTGYTVSSPDMTTAGEKTVTVTYEGKSSSYNITVSAAPTPGGMSGTYTTMYLDSVAGTINFDNCTYSRGSETVVFTYSVSGTNITFTYESGSMEYGGNFYMFKSGEDTNSTGTISNSTQFTLRTYNASGANSYLRTFTKA